MHSLEVFKFCPRCGSRRFEPKSALSKKCEECGFEFFKNAVSAVAVFAVDDKGRLLVSRRAKDPAKGTLDLPGGFVDPEETMEDAVVRELQEETGLRVKTVKYLFSIPNIYPYTGFDVSTLDLFVEAEIDDFSSIKIQEKELSEVLFLEKGNIISDDFGLRSIKEGVKRWLALQQK